MAELKIRIPCVVCSGSKEQEEKDPITGAITMIPCGSCEATGYAISGTINITDIEDKLKDILDKVNDIKEKVDEL